MEQRPLRLGDIVDDYCPRERRITNHAIVAIIENTVRQTRCTTCDAEHVYKEAKVPRRRKAEAAATEAPGQLIAPKGTEVPDSDAAPAEAPATSEPLPLAAAEAPAADPPRVEPPATVNGSADHASDEDAAEPETEPAEDVPDGWLSHRRLIRATLPRVDGEPPARPIPEFTMHQRQTRGSHMFRNGHGGNHQGQGGNHHGGGGQGRNGNSHGNGNGGGRGRNRSGRRHKRSR